MENGEKPKSDKENMKIMEPQCIKVFNNHRPIHPEALKFIHRREGMEHLQDPITWKEFKKAVNELKNDKSPGLNEIPGEAFKAMNKTNLQKVF
ncbi:hypothetical protein ACHAWF_001432, partial [Thalassiosira exigua]